MFPSFSQSLYNHKNVEYPFDEFRAFVGEANRLQCLEAKSSSVSRTRELVPEFEQRKADGLPSPPVADFTRFVGAALPLVVLEIKSLLPRLSARVALAERWLVPHDLLFVAGFSFIENSYTALMKWALDPATHPPSARRRQRAWLRALGLDENVCGTTACVPKTQLVTHDGIPDLILRFENVIVVVEA